MNPPRSRAEAVAWLAKRFEYRRAVHQEWHVEPRPLTRDNVMASARVELLIFNLSHEEWFAKSDPMKQKHQ